MPPGSARPALVYILFELLTEHDSETTGSERAQGSAGKNIYAGRWHTGLSSLTIYYSKTDSPAQPPHPPDTTPGTHPYTP